jgi:N-acetylneuraminic acid mutarotase
MQAVSLRRLNYKPYHLRDSSNMTRRKLASLSFLAFALISTSAVQAHFPWVVRGEDGKVAYFFGEGLNDRTYKLPPAIAAAKLAYFADGSLQPIEVHAVEREDFAGLVSDSQVPANALLISKTTFGIYKGARLDYYTMHQAGPLPSDRTVYDSMRSESELFAEIVDADKGVDVYVTWQGKPIADIEVHLYCADGHEEGNAKTDATGKVSFTDKEVEEGLNGIMLGHTVKQAGKLKDAAYESASHYLTMTFHDPSEDKADMDSSSSLASSLAPLPFEITSFGAVRAGNAIYVYGGHTGNSHSYSNEDQSNKLLKLDLSKPSSEWSEIATGERLQGLGMVHHDGKLILVGGFTALNDAGDEHDLHSQATVKTYDLSTGTWGELPSLPEPRSSHDVAMVGDVLYVVGGWSMDGEKEAEWRSTAWSMDLASDDPKWVSVTEPPFQRRALATVAHAGKLFVIGGMNKQGGPTKDVVIYDPSTKAWSESTALNGSSAMAGFGASGWSLDGKLIITTYEGDIQVWDETDKMWKQAGKTADARFFHRMVPLDANHLVSIGGANMEQGKYLNLEPVSAK